MENYKARAGKAFGDAKKCLGQASKRAKIALIQNNASLLKIKF